MKRLFIVLCLLVNSIIFAQIKNLKIYPNFNDCANCNTGLNFLKSIPEDYQVTFFVSNKQKDYLQLLLESYELNRKYNIVYIKNFTNSSKSQCSYYDNNLKVDTFPLVDLNKKNYLFSKKISYNLNDTLKVSDRCDFQITKIALITTDYLLNRVTYNSFIEKKQPLIIEGKQFNPRSFFELGNIDSVSYWKNFNTLKYLGKHYPHIDVSYLNDTCLYLLLSFPYPELDLKKELHIKIKAFIYKRNLNNGSRKLYYLSDIDLSSKIGSKIYMDNLMPFYVAENKIFISGYANEEYSKKYWYYENIFDKDTLKFTGRLVKLPLDSITHTKFKKQIEETNHLANKKFVFISGIPFIFNHLNAQHHFIKDSLACSNNSFINDVSEDKTNLYILSVKNDQAYHHVYKKENYAHLKTKKIPLTESDIPASVKFKEDAIFILNSNKFNYRLISIE